MRLTAEQQVALLRAHARVDVDERTLAAWRVSAETGAAIPFSFYADVVSRAHLFRGASTGDVELLTLRHRACVRAESVISYLFRDHSSNTA